MISFSCCFLPKPVSMVTSPERELKRMGNAPPPRTRIANLFHVYVCVSVNMCLCVFLFPCECMCVHVYDRLYVYYRLHVCVHVCVYVSESVRACVCGLNLSQNWPRTVGSGWERTQENCCPKYFPSFWEEPSEKNRPHMNFKALSCATLGLREQLAFDGLAVFAYVEHSNSQSLSFSPSFRKNNPSHIHP